MKKSLFVTLVLFSCIANAGRYSCVVKEASELSDTGIIIEARLPLEKIGDSFAVDETTGVIVSAGEIGGTNNTAAGTPVVAKRNSFISVVNHPSGDISLLQIENGSNNSNTNMPFIFLKTIGSATYVTGACKYSL